jgi:hypothetical protein
MQDIKGSVRLSHLRAAYKPLDTNVSWKALLAWDSMALLMICLADMLSTLYFVHAHMATESNPVMAYWLSMGDGAFCAAKVISFLPLLFVAAYYRASRPKLVQVSLRGAIVLYLTIYVVAVGSQGIMHA